MRSNADEISLQADREKHSESAVCRVVTNVSSACDSASYPVAAASAAGWDVVSFGSRIATRYDPLPSPHDIRAPVSESTSVAEVCASLPEPAVVGTAIIGSMGREAFP